MIHSTRYSCALLGATLLLASAAEAADVYVPPVEPAAPVAESLFDISFGSAVTTDYVFRGVSQSDGNAAFQSFVEASYGIVYGGIWGSTIDFGDDDEFEYDLYAGIRPVWGPVSFDLGYVRYFYNDSGDANGEIYGKASISPVEPLTLGGAVFWDPENEYTYLEANAAYALPYDFSVSGAVGTVNDSPFTPDYVTWNVGVSYTWKDTVTFDVRYHDTDGDAGCGALCDERVVGTLSLSTSFKKLGLLQ